MSDAAARRRERILAASGSRMQMVGGGALVEEKPVPSEGVDEGDTSAATMTGSSGGSNRARNRRLQSRNITIAPKNAATETSTSTEETQEGQTEEAAPAPATATAPVPAEEVPLEKEEEEDESETTDASAAAAAPTIVPLPAAAEPVATLDADQSSSSSSGLPSVAFTTGGNALRRRFQASRAASADLGDVMAGKEEGGVANTAEELKKAKLGKQQPHLPSPSLMAMLISSEALVRFWLLCVAGVSAGAWVVQQNAEMLSWHKDQQAELEAMGTTETSASRAALDDFLALNGVDGSEGAGAGGGTRGGGSSKARGLWNWVYGLFLPETFNSLPLPFMAVLWHAIIVVGLLTLRPVGSRAGQHQRRPSMVNITGVEQEGEGTELIPKDDQQQQQAPLTNAGNQSFFETVVHSLGLGPLLTAFNLAQTAWQEMLIFCFFFLLTVSVRS